ncbi:conserved hypothetical protein [metagenome]|uniref:Thioesterase family protein n=1 Tax=metagenome TaxID=256318 RepID=A0A2P2BXT7_9ZZZZ
MTETDGVDDLDAFYRPVDDDLFESTEATASPWDPTLQHGGPPAALLARAVERSRPDGSMPIARITVDMLRGIPQGRIRTEATVVRPGRRVELVEARLFANDTLAVTATAWRIRSHLGATAAQATPSGEAGVLPAEQPQAHFPGVSRDWGYGRAVEWRFVEGGYDVLGPATVWTRLRIPLVAGEQTSPIARLLVVADSTNGLSGVLPLAQWLFIPPTLTVTIQRPPASEWMLVHATSTVGPNGIGLAQGSVHDDDGLVAHIAQPLVVTPRASPEEG